MNDRIHVATAIMLVIVNGHVWVWGIESKSRYDALSGLATIETICVRVVMAFGIYSINSVNFCCINVTQMFSNS